MLVSQNDAIAGLFLYDALQEADFERFSFKLDGAIDAIAIDCAKEGCVAFAAEDNSFTVVSADDVGESRTYKFVCANACGWASWRSQLLPRHALQNTHTHPTQDNAACVSPATSLRQEVQEQQRQEVQELQQQLARASETARVATQKLSSMEVAYKCTPVFVPPFRSFAALVLRHRLSPVIIACSHPLAFSVLKAQNEMLQERNSMLYQSAQSKDLELSHLHDSLG